MSQVSLYMPTENNFLSLPAKPAVHTRTSNRGINSGYRLNVATGLHQGDREQQQDQVIVLTHPHAAGCVMGVVADGMGGCTGGRKASNQVMLTTRQLFEAYLPSIDHPAELLCQIALQTHRMIKLTAITTEQEPHSTIAAFLINPGGECVWLHSGDSRIYYFDHEALVKRTLDHSYVQMLVNEGLLTEQQAVMHPQANVLTSCLGLQERPRVEISRIPQLKVGDSLLACSDGLWHYFTSEELADVVSSMPPRQASELLVRKARERARGNGDNLSLVIVRIDPLAPNEKTTGSGFIPLH